jgi:hypothetical protein
MYQSRKEARLRSTRTRTRSAAIRVIAGLLLAACQSGPTSVPTSIPSTVLPGPTASAFTTSAPPSTSSSPLAGACGATQVFAGPGPDADLGLADNPWASATPLDERIVAYFWRPPPDLVNASGAQDPHGTKVLWVTHDVEGNRLTIADVLTILAHPPDGSSPMIHLEFPAATSPGGNYPSSLDLPSPGCWHLDLMVGTVSRTMDLLVAPAR